MNTRREIKKLIRQNQQDRLDKLYRFVDSDEFVSEVDKVFDETLPKLERSVTESVVMDMGKPVFLCWNIDKDIDNRKVCDIIKRRIEAKGDFSVRVLRPSIGLMILKLKPWWKFW